ncbi:MAG TPA: hypothetical protein VK742_21220 [Candidatus Sulfotelmatobacter sp.]|jgi:hypothetical protein|nr:hypothetical protein [Candidatus Sulfotelmatobacter sp.]
MNSNIGPEGLPRTGGIEVEFISTEPLAIDIKCGSITAPPTLPMVKTFDSNLEFKVESPSSWDAASAFKNFLAKLKLSQEY